MLQMRDVILVFSHFISCQFVRARENKFCLQCSEKARVPVCLFWHFYR